MYIHERLYKSIATYPYSFRVNRCMVATANINGWSRLHVEVNVTMIMYRDMLCGRGTQCAVK